MDMSIGNVTPVDGELEDPSIPILISVEQHQEVEPDQEEFQEMKPEMESETAKIKETTPEGRRALNCFETLTLILPRLMPNIAPTIKI